MHEERNIFGCKEITNLVLACHKIRKEAWIADSIMLEELPDLLTTGVDVICTRGATCEQESKGCFAKAKAMILTELEKQYQSKISANSDNMAYLLMCLR